jgi:hypothetical protein
VKLLSMKLSLRLLRGTVHQRMKSILTLSPPDLALS